MLYQTVFGLKKFEHSYENIYHHLSTWYEVNKRGHHLLTFKSIQTMFRGWNLIMWSHPSRNVMNFDFFWRMDFFGHFYNLNNIRNVVLKRLFRIFWETDGRERNEVLNSTVLRKNVFKQSNCEKDMQISVIFILILQTLSSFSCRYLLIHSATATGSNLCFRNQPVHYRRI